MKDIKDKLTNTARATTAVPLASSRLGVLPARSPIRPHRFAAGARWGTPLAVTPSQTKRKISVVQKDSRPYRENVVGFILNRKHEVLIMKRARAEWHWQLPQGGVEPHETKRDAVLREMREETGLKGLRIIGVVENFHAYDWPKAPLYARDEFRGQRQTLFFLRYTAKGLGVSLDPKEATGSRWVPMKDLLKWLAPVRHQMAGKALRHYQELFKKI